MEGEITWGGLLKLLGGLVTLLSIGLILVAAFPGRHKPNTQSPPIFPGAQQVQVQQFDEALHPVEPYKVISFKTSDRPEAILAFYKDTLAKDGWRVTDYPENRDPLRLHAYWDDGEPCRLWYGIDVTAQPEGIGEAKGKIELVSGGCR